MIILVTEWVFVWKEPMMNTDRHSWLPSSQRVVWVSSYFTRVSDLKTLIFTRLSCVLKSASAVSGARVSSSPSTTAVRWSFLVVQQSETALVILCLSMLLIFHLTVCRLFWSHLLFVQECIFLGFSSDFLSPFVLMSDFQFILFCREVEIVGDFSFLLFFC